MVWPKKEEQEEGGHKHGCKYSGDEILGFDDFVYLLLRFILREQKRSKGDCLPWLKGDCLQGIHVVWKFFSKTLPFRNLEFLEGVG